MPRPQYEALNSHGLPYMRLAQVIDELATPEDRVTALKQAGTEISSLLQLPLLKPIDYGTPVHLAFGLTRNLANPMRSLVKSFSLPNGKMDITRSFTEGDWQHVLRCLAEIPEALQRDRLTCLLEPLVTSGVRLEELARATHWDLRAETLPDLPETWVLTVTGKRNKKRDIPLNTEVVKHEAQLMRGDQKLADADAQRLPLIRTLYASAPTWGKGEGGQLHAAQITQQAGAALSAAGIYAVSRWERNPDLPPAKREGFRYGV